MCIFRRSDIPVWVVFTQGGGTLILFASPLFVDAEIFPVALLDESIYVGLPRLVCGLILVVKVLVLEEATQVHLPDEEFVFVSKVINSNSAHSICR